MNKFKVYLAGPISGLTFDESQDWRDYAYKQLKLFSIDGYSPLRQKGFLRAAGVLSGSYKNPMATARGIIARDHFDCMTSDLILVNLLGAKTVSIGTVMEIAWAHAYNKPLVVAMEETSNIHEHPMLLETIDYRLPDLDAALAVVQAILLPN